MYPASAKEAGWTMRTNQKKKEYIRSAPPENEGTSCPTECRDLRRKGQLKTVSQNSPQPRPKMPSPPCHPPTYQHPTASIGRLEGTTYQHPTASIDRLVGREGSGEGSHDGGDKNHHSQKTKMPPRKGEGNAGHPTTKPIIRIFLSRANKHGTEIQTARRQRSGFFNLTRVYHTTKAPLEEALGLLRFLLPSLLLVLLPSSLEQAGPAVATIVDIPFHSLFGSLCS